MKNLPNKFPIRYAIIVDNEEDSSVVDGSLFSYKKQYELLFRQLIMLLQKIPLDETLLMPTAKTIKFTLMGIEIMNIAKLNASFDWIDQLREGILKTIPEAKLHSISNIVSFNIGLYSYRGADETPSFIMANDIPITSPSREEQIKEKSKIFGYINDSDTKFANNLYNKFIHNTINSAQLYELTANYSKPTYISIPYSKLWAILDSQFQEGTVSCSDAFKKDIIEKLKSDEETLYNKGKIMVAICKSWGELFIEEILVLYKMYNFCKNCGKALPLNYQGRYCPDKKENIECKKERNRNRARKYHN